MQTGAANCFASRYSPGEPVENDNEGISSFVERAADPVVTKVLVRLDRPSGESPDSPAFIDRYP